jgi:hypothetical protein
MAKQLLNRGSAPNDGTGDGLRTGAEKINANFSEIYSVLGDGDNLLTTDIDFGTNKLFYSNFVTAVSDLSSIDASKYNGLVVHVQETGALYYAHAGAWRKLLTDNAANNIAAYTDSLNTVAYSGNYNDLSNRPSIPSQVTDLGIVDGSAGQVLSTDGTGNFTFRDVEATSIAFSNVTNKPTTLAGYGINDAFTGRYEDLLNKPTLFSGDYDDLANKPTIPADVGDLTDDSNLLFDGEYTSLNGRPVIPTDLGDLTDTENLLFSRSYNDLTNKPTSFAALTTLQMALGVEIDEFSNDVAMTDNSASALVTERAVKTYVANQIATVESPVIPETLTDLGISDGTNGQVLTTDGLGTFTFEDAGDTIGNFTLSSSVIDTDDSSAITITPAVTMSSDLTVENDLIVNNDVEVAGRISASSIDTGGTGSSVIEAGSNLELTAGNAVVVTSSPMRMASFTTTERDALAAQNGDIIYNTTDNKFQGYENGSWVNLV